MSKSLCRATHNLVLSDQLREAYDAVDYDLRVWRASSVRSATEDANHPTMGVAAHYQTSHRAGAITTTSSPYQMADGIFIADVSGHGTRLPC